MGQFATRGHAAALAVVERAIRSGRPAHALLLSGPPGVGKTTLALDLAAGLLCLADDPTTRPCRACSACRKVDSGNHPDVHRLVPEGAGQQIRLGQVQVLAAELALLPLEGRCRVAIIEQAQRLNLDAQNALLKTLEEPPAQVTLVLAADEPTGLLPTVVSRCARLRVGPLVPSLVGQLLAERGLVDVARGEALGRQSGGLIGVALDLARQPELLLVRERLARTLLDLLAADRRTRLAAAPVLVADGTQLALAGTGDPSGDAEAEATAELTGRGRAAPARSAPAERRAAVAQVLAIWRELARDLAFAARGAAAELRERELIDELREVGRRVEGAAMAHFVQRLDALSRALDAYANPELLLDVLLLEWQPGEPAGKAAA